MIGVFDSGLGGLTVVKELFNLLPEYQILYFGDTARLPYGTKQDYLIRQWSKNHSDWLIDHGAGLVVIACHTASSWAYDILSKQIEKPLFDVLTPGIKEALSVSLNRKIGVIGTPGTIESKIYEKRIVELEGEASLFMQACPLFVPIIEEGWMSRPGTKEIAQEYLVPLKEKGIDTLIMGCTHYPLLEDLITDIMGPSVKIVNPAKMLAQNIVDFLRENPDVESNILKGKDHRFYFSARPYHLELISQLCLNQSIEGEIIYDNS
jgi:glutamate racemase